MDSRKRFAVGLRLISLAVLVVGWNEWCRVEEYSFSWDSEWEHFWRGLVARHDLSLFAVTVLAVVLVAVGILRCVDALVWGGAGGTQGADTEPPSADRDGPPGDRMGQPNGVFSALETRAMVLTCLVEWNAPLTELSKRLGEFAGDVERWLVTVRGSHVASVLRRYLTGEFSASAVGEWAELLEGRSDLGFVSELVTVTVQSLANQAIEGELTSKVAKVAIEALAADDAGRENLRVWTCPVDLIDDAQRVVDVYGHWPVFHDAEVMGLMLDRTAQGNPTLELVVYLFQMTDEVDAAGYFVLIKHSLVALRFLGVDAVDLSGFNASDILFSGSGILDELRIFALDPDQNEGRRIGVELDNIHGLVVGFQCVSCQVVDVRPYDRAAKDS